MVFVKVLISSLIMGAVAILALKIVPNSKLLSVFVPSALGAFVYFVCVIAFKIPEIYDIVNSVLKKVKGGNVIE